jgi:putative membrane protein
MGIADVIPGASGGTIAFLTGIYEELIYSIRSLDADALKLLFNRDVSTFWKKINGKFLTAVAGGMLTSLLLFSNLMHYFLKHHAIMTWAFFFGLITMSIPLMMRNIKKWSTREVVAFLIGTGVTYLITTLPPLQTSNNLFFVFLSGMFSICGLVLPGISGVSLLMLAGKYQTIVSALNELQVGVLMIFIAGSILGLFLVSRFLTWALLNFRNVTIALLIGCITGVLNKVWPWRNVLEYATNVKGDQIAVFDKSVLPWHYLSDTGKDPQLFQAILMMALGVLLVVVIEKIAVRLKMKH